MLDNMNKHIPELASKIINGEFIPASSIRMVIITYSDDEICIQCKHRTIVISFNDDGSIDYESAGLDLDFINYKNYTEFINDLDELKNDYLKRYEFSI